MEGEREGGSKSEIDRVKGEKSRGREAGREGGEKRTVEWLPKREREKGLDREEQGREKERNYRREGRGIKKHGDSNWNRN